MQLQQLLWTAPAHWQVVDGDLDKPAQLVLYFAAPGVMTDGRRLGELRERFSKARIIGCTTGGEILGNQVHDNSLVATAIAFDDAQIRVASRNSATRDASFRIGAEIAAELAGSGLKGLFVLSDGTMVNGSELVRGLKSAMTDGVVLTGGLAGDGDTFGSTLVGADVAPTPGTVLGIGFYGDKLTFRHGSFGGWDAFGPERLVTRSEDNVLYELDGEPALDLYERYLGDEACHLPGSALLFPLRIRAPHDLGTDLVRTVVGIDKTSRAMIFAGDVPVGYSAQLMRGNFDHLVEGAARAARQAAATGGGALAILISCIGRKLLLGQRIDEEVETVCDVLGGQVRTIGFYSYGEICPHDFTASCELHNQTMTITLIDEA